MLWNGVTINEPYSNNGWGLSQWFPNNDKPKCSDCVSKLNESNILNLLKTEVDWSKILNGDRIANRVSFIGLCVLLLFKFYSPHFLQLY